MFSAEAKPLFLAEFPGDMRFSQINQVRGHLDLERTYLYSPASASVIFFIMSILVLPLFLILYLPPSSMVFPLKDHVMSGLGLHPTSQTKRTSQSRI